MAPASCRRMRRWPRPATSSSAGRSACRRGAAGVGDPLDAIRRLEALAAHPGDTAVARLSNAAAVASSCRRRRQPSPCRARCRRRFGRHEACLPEHWNTRSRGEPCPATIRSQSSRRSSACSNGCMRGTPACATGRWRPTSRSWPRPTRSGSVSASRPPTGRSTRSATHASRSPSSRSRSRSSTGSPWTTGERRRSSRTSAWSRPATRSTRSAWRQAPGVRSIP